MFIHILPYQKIKKNIRSRSISTFALQEYGEKLIIYFKGKNKDINSTYLTLHLGYLEFKKESFCYRNPYKEEEILIIGGFKKLHKNIPSYIKSEDLETRRLGISLLNKFLKENDKN